MKITISFLLLLSSLFFFAFSIKHSPVVAQSDLKPVRDITGKVLRTGVKYYILPFVRVRGRGGGLTVGSRNHSCPLDVVQEPLEVSQGVPLTFTPANRNKDGIIYESMDLNFKFNTITTCAQSTVWRLRSFDESTPQRFISTNGVQGNPGASTLSNWFKIDKDGDAYKLVFCPGVCNFCRPFCGEVGIYKDADSPIRNLALLSNEVKVPFKIIFKRVL